MPNFSGKWNLQSQLRGVKSKTWTGVPVDVFYIWGQSDNGRLGLNDDIDRSSPTQLGSKVLDNNRFIDIGMGQEHTHGVRINNTLWAWGENDFGRLGLGDTKDRSSPTQVGALTNWETVTGGDQCAFAIKTDGTMWGWGHNNDGVVGDPTKVVGSNQTSPLLIGSWTTWSQVSGGGGDNGAAVATDGTLWTWGSANNGRLGHNNSISRSSPTQVGSETDWAKVSFGRNHCLGLTTSGELYAWGDNQFGHLGQGDTVNRSSPTQIGVGTDWSEIAAGGGISVAVKTDGTLWTWGDSSRGALGHGDNIDRSSPTQVGALTNWEQVAASNISGNNNRCFAIKTDGTLWAWGAGAGGRLGIPSTSGVDISSPTQVGSNTDWTYIKELGQAHSSAISTERTQTPRST